MKQNNGAKKVEGLGNVDQIREIIFGSQMRELDQRFSKMETALQTLKNEMAAQMREVKAQMQSELNSGIELLETKLKNLANLSKEEREALREELLRTDKRLNMALDSLGEENETKLNLLKKETQAANDRMKNELSELRRQINESLDSRLSAMGEAKVSRDAMADLLLDMAVKIKGEGLDIAVETVPNEAEK